MFSTVKKVHITCTLGDPKTWLHNPMQNWAEAITSVKKAIIATLVVAVKSAQVYLLAEVQILIM